MLGILCLVSSLAVEWSPWDSWLYPHLVAWQNSVIRPRRSPNVAIVEVDAEAAARWPFPRSTHARLLHLLKQGGARAVAFDFIFARPTAEDAELGRAMAECGMVVCAMDYRVGYPLPAGWSQGLPTEVPAALRYPVEAVRKSSYPGVVINHYDAMRRVFEGRLVGQYFVPSDSEAAGQRRQMDSFAFATARVYLGLQNTPLHSPPGGAAFGNWTCGTLVVPGTALGTYLVHYGGPPRQVFPHYRYDDVIKGSKSGFSDSHQQGKLVSLREAFADKAVVVMATFDPNDYWYAPGLVERIAGGHVHAYMLDTILSGTAAQYVPVGYLLLLLPVVALATAIAYRIRHPLVLVGAIALFDVLLLATSVWGFIYVRLLLPVFALIVTFTASGAVMLLGEVMWGRRLLTRYLSDSVAHELLRQADRREVSAARRYVTVLMSDINDYTGICERETAELVIEALNEYVVLMEKIILEEGGTLKQLVGDELVVMFGETRVLADAPLRAVRTAWRMQSRLKEWSSNREAVGKFGFAAKIGLHAGEVVVGDVGSAHRAQYSAIGDVMNTTARIEALNKELGTEILMSREVYDQVREQAEARAIGMRAVKGRQAEIEVFELLGVVSVW